MGASMQFWEIERGPDRTFDILLNGRPEGYGYDKEQVLMYFESRNVELEEVEGHELLG